MQEVHSFKKSKIKFGGYKIKDEKNIFSVKLSIKYCTTFHTQQKNKPPLPDCNYINYFISITFTDDWYLFHN